MSVPRTASVPAAGALPGTGARRLGTWAVGFRLARYYPQRYLLGGSMWAVNHSLPVVGGLALKALFDRIADGSSPGDGALALVAAVVVIEIVHALVLAAALVLWPAWWHSVFALISANVLESVLSDPQPPARRMPGSAGEAVGRFREDVADLVWFVDVWVDVAGGVVFTGLALVVMGLIDLRTTVFVVLPMVAVVVATRMLSRRIRRLHGATRQSGANVSSLVGELFASVLAIKTAGAERRSLSRLKEENQARQEAAVRANVAATLIPATSEAAAVLTIGVVLLLSADRMRSGQFTVGDLALFIVYAEHLTGLPRWVGRMLAKHREATVAVERLGAFLDDRDPARLVAHRRLRVANRETTGNPSLGWTAPGPRAGRGACSGDDRLRRLDVRGLTARHPSSARGVVDVDLTVEAGTFTVVTGAVGAGKTTLVRALLGALEIEQGEVRWNGMAVDPRTDLGPSRAAYAGQVPRLFSAPLAENLVLGAEATDDDVAAALAAVALDADVSGFPHGLNTVVGPRGARLSGGQQQRAATARALVRRPDLLVMDDPSSALDVETEARLWANLATAGTTVLAVSHRAAALERADQVVVLDRGRVVGTGRLPHLLETCAEMRRIWREELVVEGEEALTG